MVPGAVAQKQYRHFTVGREMLLGGGEVVYGRLAPSHHVHSQLIQERKGNQSTEDELQEVFVSSVSYRHILYCLSLPEQISHTAASYMRGRRQATGYISKYQVLLSEKFA
jgi:hypothetical protein